MTPSLSDENLGDYRFAHDEAVLKLRQRKYIEYFKTGPIQSTEEKPLLDLGCGSGYFLDLLREANIPAVGVDGFEAAVEECHSRGHENSVQADALFFLDQRHEEYSGIFCSHLIEHLGPKDAQNLIEGMKRALIPGGRAVVVTPNPLNLHVLAETFYLDQTHVRPYPLKLLERLFNEAQMRIVDQGFDPDTAPKHPWWKWPLHFLRQLILGRYYTTGEDTFIVVEKPANF